MKGEQGRMRRTAAAALALVKTVQIVEIGLVLSVVARAVVVEPG